MPSEYSISNSFPCHSNVRNYTYINDIVKADKYFAIRLFADGTSLTATGNGFGHVALNKINSELPAISKWLRSNKLTLNLIKTNISYFNLDKKLIVIHTLLLNSVISALSSLTLSNI